MILSKGFISMDIMIGGNILDLSDIKYCSTEDITAFYVKVRSRICDHLKKKGDRIDFLDNLELIEDEILSPTFEEMILIWCLEKIDPKLPKKVNEKFGDQLVDSTLKGLQGDIFENFLKHANFQFGPSLRDKLIKEEDVVKDEIGTARQLQDIAKIEQLLEVEVDMEDREDYWNNDESIQSDPDFEHSDTTCHECGKVFKSKKHLKFHMRHHKVKPKTCTVCGKHFENMRSYYCHKLTHKVQPTKCRFCNKVFKNKGSIRSHTRKHFERGVTCTNCEQEFTNQSEYESHMRDEHNEENFTVELMEDEVNQLADANNEDANIMDEDGADERKDIEDIGEDSNKDKNGEQTLNKDHDSEDKVVGQDNECKDDVDSTSVTCKKCQKQFRSEKLLKLHMRHHRVDPCTCTVCGKSFANKIRLGAHRMIHKIEPCTCLECGKQFQTKISLNDHMNRHKVQPCVCEFCNREYNNKEALRMHKYFKHYTKGLRCTDCDVVVYNQSAHEEHINNFHPDHDKSKLNFKTEGDDSANGTENVVDNKHDGVDTTKPLMREEPRQQHPCEMCGQLFKGSAALRNHQLLQHGQKIECEMCGEEFSSKRLLRIHLKSVHDISRKSVEKIPCEICGKLITPQLMKQHLTTHTQVLPLRECQTCKRKFKNMEQMSSHICKHFSCDQCDLKFVRNRNLQAHKLEHEGVLMYHCDECEAMFKRQKDLGSHKRFVHRGVRRYACTLCDKKFAVSNGLKDHMRGVHTGEKPFKCEECGVGFSQKSGLISHSRLHTNEFAAECDVCHQKFRMLGNLKVHKESKVCGMSNVDSLLPYKNTSEL